MMILGQQLADKPLAVLKEIMAASGVDTCRITSVQRTPADQARVMYEMILQHGFDYAMKLYEAPGKAVCMVYKNSGAAQQPTVLAAMEAKICELGPSNVSHHCSTTHYVFDVAPSSIPADKHAVFAQSAKDNKSVSKVLQPPSDPAFHIEIPKEDDSTNE